VAVLGLETADVVAATNRGDFCLLVVLSSSFFFLLLLLDHKSN
tara:strand:+ start:481 stop:609 length:129 start_codon:yes stop_codon:yes gene_type:complete